MLIFLNLVYEIDVMIKMRLVYVYSCIHSQWYSIGLGLSFFGIMHDYISEIAKCSAVSGTKLRRVLRVTDDESCCGVRLICE